MEEYTIMEVLLRQVYLYGETMNLRVGMIIGVNASLETKNIDSV